MPDQPDLDQELHHRMLSAQLHRKEGAHLNNDPAYQLADTLIAGTPLPDIPRELVDVSEEPTLLSQLSKIESVLRRAFNDATSRVEKQIIQLENKYRSNQTASLLEQRSELLAPKNRILRGLDHLLSTPTHVVQPQEDAEDFDFYGWLVADVSSQRGKVPRWVELYLYRTLDGQWVAQELRVSTLDGEDGISRLAVVDTDREVAEFFGHGSLAQSIYSQAGIVPPK